MAVKIRLSRCGGKQKPFYRIVATDKESSRDGKFLEVLGTYDPRIEKGFNFKKDRVDYWISKGAKPSGRVSVLFKEANAANA